MKAKTKNRNAKLPQAADRGGLEEETDGKGEDQEIGA